MMLSRITSTAQHIHINSTIHIPTSPWAYRAQLSSHCKVDRLYIFLLYLLLCRPFFVGVVSSTICHKNGEIKPRASTTWNSWKTQKQKNRNQRKKIHDETFLLQKYIKARKIWVLILDEVSLCVSLLYYNTIVIQTLFFCLFFVAHFIMICTYLHSLGYTFWPTMIWMEGYNKKFSETHKYEKWK